MGLGGRASNALPHICPVSLQPCYSRTFFPLWLVSYLSPRNHIELHVMKNQEQCNNPNEVDFPLHIKISRVGQLQAGTLT